MDELCRKETGTDLDLKGDVEAGLASRSKVGGESGRDGHVEGGRIQEGISQTRYSAWPALLVLSSMGM